MLAEIVKHMEEPMGAGPFKWTRVATDIAVPVTAMVRGTALPGRPKVFANFTKIRD